MGLRVNGVAECLVILVALLGIFQGRGYFVSTPGVFWGSFPNKDRKTPTTKLKTTTPPRPAIVVLYTLLLPLTGGFLLAILVLKHRRVQLIKLAMHTTHICMQLWSSTFVLLCCQIYIG